MVYKYKGKEKEYQKEYQKIYRNKKGNKLRIKRQKKIYNKKYYFTYEAQRRNSITTWQQIGIKLKPNEDWISIYDYYISWMECPNCGIEFGEGVKRNLDHDHDTGYIREGLICHRCNILRH